MDKNEIYIEMGKKFNSAAAFVTGASQYGNAKISQSDQLKLYGFYKQSTCFGDFASTFKPSFWNFAATRKYWAWEAQSKLTKYQAKVLEIIPSVVRVCQTRTLQKSTVSLKNAKLDKHIFDLCKHSVT